MRHARKALLYCVPESALRGGDLTRHGDALLSALEHRRDELVAAVGDVDVHLAVPAPTTRSWLRDPGRIRVARTIAGCGGRVHGLGGSGLETTAPSDDEGRAAGDGDRWQRLSDDVATRAYELSRAYEHVLVIAADLPYLGAPTAFAGLPHRRTASGRTDFLLVIPEQAATNEAPGRPAGRHVWERQAVTAALTDPQTWIADAGDFLSGRLMRGQKTRPRRLVPFGPGLDTTGTACGPMPEEQARAVAQSWGVPLDTPSVLAVGPTVPRGGMAELVRRLEPLRDRLHLIIVATDVGEGATAVARAHRIGAEHGNATVLTRVTPDLPRALASLATTRIVTYPSIAEASGTLPFEIALWARERGPVAVVPDRGSFREHVRHGVNGLVYDPRERDGLAAAVGSVLALAPRERVAMRAAAADLVRRERDVVANLARAISHIGRTREAASVAPSMDAGSAAIPRSRSHVALPVVARPVCGVSRAAVATGTAAETASTGAAATGTAATDIGTVLAASAMRPAGRSASAADSVEARPPARSRPAPAAEPLNAPDRETVARPATGEHTSGPAMRLDIGRTGLAGAPPTRGAPARRASAAACPLLIVDGEDMLRRARSYVSVRITSMSGSDITTEFGCFALLHAASTLLEQPHHVVVAFDGGQTANRPPHSFVKSPLPDSTRPHDGGHGDDAGEYETARVRSTIEKGLDWAGATVLRAERYRASDVIATAVARTQGRARTVMSTRQTFYQLLGSDVVVLNTARKGPRRLVDAEGLWRRYGVEPGQWPEFRALTGEAQHTEAQHTEAQHTEAQHTVPGLRGIGEKTAARVLGGGWRLEDVIRSARPADRTAMLVRGHEMDVLRWRDALTLDANLPLPMPTLPTTSVPVPPASEIVEKLGLW